MWEDSFSLPFHAFDLAAPFGECVRVSSFGDRVFSAQYVGHYFNQL